MNKEAILKFCLGTLCLLGQTVPLWAATANPARSGIQLISCDRTGALIEVQIPPMQIAPTSHEGEDYSIITLPGWNHQTEEGSPSLPVSGLLVALPPGASPSLSIELLASHSVSSAPPLPVPTQQVDLKGRVLSDKYQPDPAVYASSATFPTNWASLGEPVWQRTYWVVPLRINPVRFQGPKGDLLVADKLRIRLTFSGGRAGRIIPDPYGEQLARQTLINFLQARGWQEKSGGPPPQISQTYGKYKVLVEHDGLYSITYDDLFSAGITPENIDPQSIQLKVKVEQGPLDTISQIPIWVNGQDESDLQFDPDDYVLFFGLAPRGTYTYSNLYTLTNVYWLDWGDSPGLRLTTHSVAPGSAVLADTFRVSTRAEIDTMYEKFGFAPLTDDIEHWMWFRLDNKYSDQFSKLFTLPEHVVAPGLDYQLTVSLRGYTYSEINDPDSLDHRVYVYWNYATEQNKVLDASFDLQTGLIDSVTVPYSLVAPNVPNDVIIQAPEVPWMVVVGNSFYLDWIKIDYWRTYRVLNDTLLFQKPQNLAPGQIRYSLPGLQDDSLELWNLSTMQRLVGFDRNQDTISFQDFSADTTFYFVAGRSAWLTPQITEEIPSSWKSDTLHADYLMISHEDFLGALSPLVQHYQQDRSLDVALVNVDDLYDEFNFGMKDPQAIFDFIQYAFFNYQIPSPSFVLLVGDASWDYKNFDNLPYQDFVPTHHFMSYKWGETASDNWFVAVTGNDPEPDCFLGRLPVNSVDETNVLVQKTLSYADAPPGLWRQQLIITNGAYNDIEDAPYFDSTVQALLDDNFPSWYSEVVPRVYLLPSAGNEQYYGTSEDLISYFNLGSAYVNYIGHAGNQMWETMTQAEISQLNNGNKLPFVGSYSCFTGIFSNTTGFGESIILKSDGGAVAYWSNAGVGYMFTNFNINAFLFEKLFQEQVATIGEATTAAKWEYFAVFPFNPGDVINTFTLLGDPGSLFVFDTPDSATLMDPYLPNISIALGDSAGPQFPNGDFIDNPFRIFCSIFDSTEIYTSSFELQLWLSDSLVTNYNAISGFPTTKFTFLSSEKDTGSQGDFFGVAYTDTLPAGDWQISIGIDDANWGGNVDSTITFSIAEGQLFFDGRPLNYPNPFSQSTSFAIPLNMAADVTIKIFTVSGKLIRTLHEPAIAGYNIVPWDGRDQEGDPLSNGAYLYKIIARSGDQQIEKVEKLAKIQ